MLVALSNARGAVPTALVKESSRFMAESQALYSYLMNGDGIETSLSSARFTPYLLRSGHNRDHAFNLYLYNARLAKAFLFPLHILEVTLRNRISDLFTRDFGQNWHNNQAFINLLTPESLAVLQKAQVRANSKSLEDVVATLTFDFWSNLFRPEYDRSLWQTRMQAVLPNTVMTRKAFQRVVKEINLFRNRVAHHEPIHTLNLTAIHTNILDAIGWVSMNTLDWVGHYSTVPAMLRTAPAANGETKPHFGERVDNNVAATHTTTPLCTLPASRFFVCHDDDQSLIAVLERQHIASYLLSKAEGADLILDLNAHSLANVIDTFGLSGNCIECGATESLSKAGELLKRRVEYIVVNEPSVLMGVIAKAHRRY